MTAHSTLYPPKVSFITPRTDGVSPTGGLEVSQPLDEYDTSPVSLERQFLMSVSCLAMVGG